MSPLRAQFRISRRGSAAGRGAGGEAIKGAQSNDIVCTLKHFALNDQETCRHVVDARIDEGALRESDLLAFQIAIERGDPGSVMCAYNKVNGEWAGENDFLLNQVLKRDWGYRGWVMSDWGRSTPRPRR
uniref:Glycoside hydrolase family 3 protein n=1 Tax=Phenylobacterium glaciei TaxID=2803784 RepID=A0A974S899_9CAUL|nr:glycoside hydrolase family 3 protein [Phenylobacterium glaciei]